jgi:hypothetical protein
MHVAWQENPLFAGAKANVCIRCDWNRVYNPCLQNALNPDVGAWNYYYNRRWTYVHVLARAAITQ